MDERRTHSHTSDWLREPVPRHAHHHRGHADLHLSDHLGGGRKQAPSSAHASERMALTVSCKYILGGLSHLKKGQRSSIECNSEANGGQGRPNIQW
jgi:hypothetical protein